MEKKERYLKGREDETGNLFPWTPERCEMGINYADIEHVKDKIFLYSKRGKFPAGGLPCLRFGINPHTPATLSWENCVMHIGPKPTLVSPAAKSPHVAVTNISAK